MIKNMGNSFKCHHVRSDTFTLTETAFLIFRIGRTKSMRTGFERKPVLMLLYDGLNHILQRSLGEITAL